ncbi:MAG: carbamate kinase [Phycisphaerales bacterium]|nr:carbamate kinase [Phycisphaerales bacterium]
MSDKPIVVVALGGNAISREEQEGNVADQFENSRMTAVALAELVEQGYPLVVTHGNGPQIGNFLLRNEAAAGAIYPLPMEVAVAHVQGGMGYMIAQALTNELHRRGFDRAATAIVTTIRVDADDPSFRNPTKPIGRVLTREDAERYERGEGWTIKETSPGKFRRVVASPMPRHIMEIKTIRRAVQAGDLLVVCGGGGIPVVEDPREGLCGVKAVIDKDLASALLAAELDAGLMLILTAVDYVSIDYGKATERQIRQMTVDEAERWLNEGQFPPGSMGPKVQGAVNFLRTARSDRAQVIIGPLHRAADAVAGRIGTRITK